MTATSTRQLKLGTLLAGVGTDQKGWRDSDLPGDTSIDIDWHIESARAAEAARFDPGFIVLPWRTTASG